MHTTFLREIYTPDQTQFVSESVTDAKGEKFWYLEGIVMQSEMKNRNGRNYPRQEISNAVATLQESINNKQCYGELDHPLDSRISVELKNVSHIFEKLTMRDNDAVGRIKILGTPMGQIAAAIIEGGGQLGVSSRGTGDVVEGGSVRNFVVSCVDIVATPSAMGAVPMSIKEALEDSISGRRVQTLAEALQEDKSAQKYFNTEVQKFLRSFLG